MKKIEILYEDDFLIIVNKPAGLAVQGGKGVKFSLDQYLKTLGASLVHRLDKDTSGVLAAAKGREAAGYLSNIMGTEGKTVKLYTAICAGCPKPDKGIITEKLLIRGSMKNSKTKYKVIETKKKEILFSGTAENTSAIENLEYSILELELGTGRMHQIRRHLAMNGNPILGDDKYGDFKLNKKLNKAAGLKHLLLHASRIIIKDKFNIDISFPLPEYFNYYYNTDIKRMNNKINK